MPDPASDNLRRSIACIVGLLQGELEALLEQKSTIKLRLRALRRRLSSLPGESPRGPKTRSKYRRSQKAAGRGQARELRQLHEQLRRACRIAFLELGGTATPDQLCSAIIRRGSFSFAAINEQPVTAIRHMLTSMAQSGEATCSSNGTHPKWVYNTDASRFPRSF